MGLNAFLLFIGFGAGSYLVGEMIWLGFYHSSRDIRDCTKISRPVIAPRLFQSEKTIRSSDDLAIIAK
jgi:hypothetical protein